MASKKWDNLLDPIQRLQTPTSIDPYDIDIDLEIRHDDFKDGETSLRSTAAPYRDGEITDIKTLFDAQFVRAKTKGSYLLLDPDSIRMTGLSITKDFTKMGLEKQTVEYNANNIPRTHRDILFTKNAKNGGGYMDFSIPTMSSITKDYSEFQGASALKDIVMTAKNMGLFNSIIDQSSSNYTGAEIRQLNENISEAIRDFTRFVNDEYMHDVIQAELFFDKKISDISEDDYKNATKHNYAEYLNKLTDEIDALNIQNELDQKEGRELGDGKKRRVAERDAKRTLEEILNYQTSNGIPEELRINEEEFKTASIGEKIDIINNLRIEVSSNSEGYPFKRPEIVNLETALRKAEEDPRAINIILSADVKNRIISLESQIKNNENILNGGLDSRGFSREAIVEFCSHMVCVHDADRGKDVSYIEPDIQRYCCELVGENYDLLKHKSKDLTKKVFDRIVRENSQCSSAAWYSAVPETWDSNLQKLRSSVKGITPEEKIHMEAAQNDLKIQLKYVKELQALITQNPNDKVLSELNETSKMNLLSKHFELRTIHGFMMTNEKSYECINEAMKKIIEEIKEAKEENKKEFKAVYGVLKELRDSHPYGASKLAARDTDKVIETVSKMETAISIDIQKELSKYVNKKEGLTVSSMIQKVSTKDAIHEKRDNEFQKMKSILEERKMPINATIMTIQSAIESGHSGEKILKEIIRVRTNNENYNKYLETIQDYTEAYKEAKLVDICEKYIDSKNPNSVIVKFTAEQADVLINADKFEQPSDNERKKLKDSDANYVGLKYRFNTQVEAYVPVLKSKSQEKKEKAVQTFSDPQVLAQKILDLREIKKQLHEDMEIKSTQDKKVDILVDSKFEAILDDTISKMQDALDAHLRSHHLFTATDKEQIEKIVSQIQDVKSSEILKNTEFAKLENTPDTKEFYDFKAFLAQEMQDYKIPKEYINTIAREIEKSGYKMPSQESIDKAIKESLNLPRDGEYKDKAREILENASKIAVYKEYASHINEYINIMKEYDATKKDVEKLRRLEDDISVFKERIEQFEEHYDIPKELRLSGEDLTPKEAIMTMQEKRDAILNLVNELETPSATKYDLSKVKNNKPIKVEDIDFGKEILEIANKNSILLTSMDLEALKEKVNEFYNDKIMEAIYSEKPKEYIESLAKEQETLNTVLQGDYITKSTKEVNERTEENTEEAKKEKAIKGAYDNLSKALEGKDYYKKGIAHIFADDKEYPKEMINDEEALKALDDIRNCRSMEGYERICNKLIGEDSAMGATIVVRNIDFNNVQNSENAFSKINSLDKDTHSKLFDIIKEIEELNLKIQKMDDEVKKLNEAKKEYESVKNGLTEKSQESIDKIIKEIDKYAEKYEEEIEKTKENLDKALERFERYDAKEKLNHDKEEFQGLIKECGNDLAIKAYEEQIKKIDKQIDELNELELSQEDKNKIKEYLSRNHVSPYEEKALEGLNVINQYGESYVPQSEKMDRFYVTILEKLTEEECFKLLLECKEKGVEIPSSQEAGEHIDESQVINNIVNNVLNDNKNNEENKKALIDALIKIKEERYEIEESFYQLNETYKSKITTEMIENNCIKNSKQFAECVNILYQADFAIEKTEDGKTTVRITDKQLKSFSNKVALIEGISKERPDLIEHIEKEDGKTVYPLLGNRSIEDTKKYIEELSPAAMPDQAQGEAKHGAETPSEEKDKDLEQQ